MDDVANALRAAYAHRDEIRALKKIDDLTRSRYDPGHFVVYELP
jgi:hypothetical protein